MTDYICTKCEYIGKRREKKRGSTALEIFLWVVLLVPGPFYTIWRMLNKSYSCPQCDEELMISAESPLGQRRIQQIENEFSHNALSKMPDMWVKDRLNQQSKESKAKVSEILEEFIPEDIEIKETKTDDNKKANEW